MRSLKNCSLNVSQLGAYGLVQMWSLPKQSKGQPINCERSGRWGRVKPGRVPGKVLHAIGMLKHMPETEDWAGSIGRHLRGASLTDSALSILRAMVVEHRVVTMGEQVRKLPTQFDGSQRAITNLILQACYRAERPVSIDCSLYRVWPAPVHRSYSLHRPQAARNLLRKCREVLSPRAVPLLQNGSDKPCRHGSRLSP